MATYIVDKDGSMRSPLTSDRPVPVVTGKRLLLALGIWALASAAAAGAMVVGLRALSPELPGAPNTLTPIIVAAVYVLLVAALAIAFRPRFRDVVALRPCRTRDVAQAAAVCAAAYLVTGAIQAIVVPRSLTATIAVLLAIGADDGRLASAGPGMTVIILVRACILAALAEEMLFRGVLYAWIRRHLSARATIPITAALFAAIHGFPAVLPLAFAMGVGYGWIRERSGSTVPSIIVHALHNVLLIALSYALTGWQARLPSWGGP